MSTPEEPPIRLNINAAELTVGDQLDLEAARTMTQLVDWMVAHAGADIGELRRLKLSELRTLAETIGQRITQEIEPSKASGARS